MRQLYILSKLSSYTWLALRVIYLVQYNLLVCFFVLIPKCVLENVYSDYQLKLMKSLILKGQSLQVCQEGAGPTVSTC